MCDENIGINYCIINENAFKLWHIRLGYISIERIKRLVNDGVSQTLDFTDFNTYIDCIKGKQTNKTTKGAKRSNKNLEIIYIEICRPFSTPCLNGQRCFTSFIDDHSRYMYLYFLNYKEEAVDAFKNYKA